MSSSVLLKIEGESVAGHRAFTWEDLVAMDERWQIQDVSRVDPKRSGGAIALAGILSAAQVDPSARYITLHSDRDNFHASVPLADVVDRGMLIYRQREEPLPISAGGPIRFLIRDFAACHSSDVDECANVKYVERIEFSSTKGFDNRPLDDDAHEALHQKGID